MNRFKPSIPTNENKTQDFYQKIAKNYDRGEVLLRSLRKAAVEISKVKPKETVLDVCTGTGLVAERFAREGADVTGIDLSHHMVSVARSKYPKIAFKIMDASKLEFLDKSFDVVNVQLGLHDMPVSLLRKTLREMRRVAHRVVVITEPHPPKNRFLKILFRYLLFSEFFEASDWRSYTLLDLESEIQKSGLQIESMRSLILGLVRVHRCNTDGERGKQYSI